MSTAQSVLEEAQSLVHGPRQADYNHPVRAYTRLARVWEGMIDLPHNTLDASKVCLMLAALKACREWEKHKRDNLVDLAGYAECASMCEEVLRP